MTLECWIYNDWDYVCIYMVGICFSTIHKHYTPERNGIHLPQHVYIIYSFYIVYQYSSSVLVRFLNHGYYIWNLTSNT